MAMNEDGNASALLDLSEGEKRARDLGRRISAEAEAWKVAQLAATLCGGVLAIGRAANLTSVVTDARTLLAESRRQAGAAAGGEGTDHG